MDYAQKVKIVEAYVAAYNSKDLEGILRLYAADAIMEDPIGDPPARGHEAIAALYRAGFEMGVQLELDGRIRGAEGAVIFPLCASTSGRRIYIIDLFELDSEGRIARMRAYWSRDDPVGEMPV